jgi:hypothetical protein
MDYKSKPVKKMNIEELLKKCAPVMEEGFSEFVVATNLGSGAEEKAAPMLYVKGTAHSCANICFYTSTLISKKAAEPLCGSNIEIELFFQVFNLLEEFVSDILICGLAADNVQAVPSYAYFGDKEKCAAMAYMIGREMMLQANKE